jgi:hypothetical protein
LHHAQYKEYSSGVQIVRNKKGKKEIFIFWIFKPPLKKKEEDASSRVFNWGTKKKKNLGKVTPQKETRDDRRRDQNDRERSDLPSPLPRFVFFSFHLSVFIPSARKGWRGEKKREHFKGVSPYSPFELSLRKTRFVCLCEYMYSL